MGLNLDHMKIFLCGHVYVALVGVVVSYLNAHVVIALHVRNAEENLDVTNVANVAIDIMKISQRKITQNQSN